MQAALQRAGAAARAAVRPRPVDAQPLHDRRDDRQQRLRLPGARLRPHRRQRRRPGRPDRLGPRLRLGPAAGGADASPRTSCSPGCAARRRRPRARSAPSSAGSAARCPATPSSTCCPSAASTSPGRWSAARARSRSSSGATVRLVDDDPAPRCWSCSATRRWPTPPTRPRASCRTGPLACEGLDSRIVDVVRDVPGRGRPRPAARRGLAGRRARRRRRRRGLATAPCAGRATPARWTHLVVADPAQAAALWRIREDGAGPRRPHQRRPPRARRLGGRRRPAGAARRLPARVRRRCWASTACTGVPYGHFGDGCMHVRIDFPFGRAAAPADGARLTAPSSRTPPELVAGYGGSLSGEHGDGRARSELLPLMYSADAIALFGGSRALFDPEDLLNPGVLVRPGAAGRRPPRRRRRAVPARTWPWPTAHDGGDLAAAVHRCTGVGKCRADLAATGGVMCPSYLATREEKDSTRGRARVLQEMLAPGGPVPAGGSPEVHEALDLCLSCKGCASDCPTGIDMATYKAEVLHQTLPPAAAAALALHARAGCRAGPTWPRGRRALVNAVLRLAPRRSPRQLAAGVDQRRTLPPFAPRTFRQLWAAPDAGRRAAGGAPVALWVDSFTDHFAPRSRVAAVRVLEAAGYRVQVPRDGVLRADLDLHRPARRRAGASSAAPSRALRPATSTRGIPVVGLEPSCTAVLRGDATELLDDPAAARVAAAARAPWPSCSTGTPGWAPPRPGRAGGRRPAALPPPRGAGLGRRRGAAGRRRRERHPARRVLRAGRQLRRRARPLRRLGGGRRASSCCPRCRTWPPRPSCWPTASPAAPSSTQLGGRRGVHLAELLARATR